MYECTSGVYIKFLKIIKHSADLMALREICEPTLVHRVCLRNFETFFNETWKFFFPQIGTFSTFLTFHCFFFALER